MRVLRWLGLGLVICVVGSLFFINPLLSKILRKQIFAELEKNCPACELNIGELKVSLFHSQLIIEDLKFKDDPQKDTACDITAEKVDSHFNLRSFLKKVPHITDLQVEAPHVTVREKDSNTPPNHAKFPSRGDELKPFPPMKVDGISVHKGHFTYEHITHGKIGKINVHNIEAETGSFATREELVTPEYDHPVEAKANALLEKSGKVLIRIKFDPYLEKNHDEIEILVEGQNMSEMNPFFVSESGLEMKGVLRKGHALIKLTQGHMSGTLGASYKDLDIKYLPTYDRGKIKSFFSNLAQSILVTRTRPKKGEEGLPTGIIFIERQPKELITKFLLRGLLDAAKKILGS